MKVKKPQSKRRSTRLQKGVQKKINAHNRKERKNLKKDVTWKSRVPKDIGIPNSFPYKAELLAEQEEQRQRDAEEKARKRELHRQQARAVGHTEEEIDEAFENEDREANKNRLAALMESAQAAVNEFDEDDEEMEDDSEEEEIYVGELDKESSRKAFDKIFKQVLEHSDIILYVLDSRNPEGTRSKQVEEAVLAHPEKRLLFVLNKIDLIPDDILRKWRSHLELSFPCLPLAAASCAPNAQTFKHKGLTQSTTSQFLLASLKNYAQGLQKKRSIAVGILGYPNVGKSSVINALTSRHGGNRQSCPVGALAGVTTSIRKVKIDNNLNLWDSPGIVFPSETQKKKKNPIEEQARLVLLNALPPRHIDDHTPAVSLLLKRLQKNPELWERLHKTYDVPPLVTEPHDSFVTAFLVHMARRGGRLKKGGVPDLKSAATAVITDWRDGRLAGWALPPSRAEQQEAKSGAASTVVERTEIVSEWAAEFKLDDLWDQSEAMEA